MIEQAAVPTPRETTITCRRCRRRYALPANGRNLLVACPRCGAAPSGLLSRLRLRHNGPAAVLSVVAIVVLAIAIALPFISMTKLGEHRVYSLVGGIMELFKSGNIFIGTILLVFSVIFPFAKLVMLLAATSGSAPLSARSRRVMHNIAVVTGKYSLLDLLVVAVMIASVLRAKYHHRNRSGDVDPAEQAETRRLREEVKELKDRIKVLERITVEKENSLARQIEELRDR